MSNDMPERPAPGRRRTPKPAADVNIDPIESPPRSERTESMPAPAQAYEQPEKKTVRVPFSNRLAEETLDILSRVKADKKIKIYEAIEIAVAEKWSEYIKK